MEYFARRFAGDLTSRVQWYDHVALGSSRHFVSIMIELATSSLFLSLMLVFDPLLSVLVAALGVANVAFIRVLIQSPVVMGTLEPVDSDHQDHKWDDNAEGQSGHHRYECPEPPALYWIPSSSSLVDGRGMIWITMVHSSSLRLILFAARIIAAATTMDPIQSQNALSGRSPASAAANTPVMKAMNPTAPIRSAAVVSRQDDSVFKNLK